MTLFLVTLSGKKTSDDLTHKQICYSYITKQFSLNISAFLLKKLNVLLNIKEKQNKTNA